MTLTTHSAIGAGIGLIIGNPFAGFTLGIISHFLVDMIPHGDSKLGESFRGNGKKKGAVTYTTIDAIIAIYTILAFINLKGDVSTLALSAAIAGSILPDFLIGVYEATKWHSLTWFNKVHFFFHDFFVKKYGDIRLRYAILGQAAFVVGLVKFFS